MGASALAMGCTGVWVGTRFIASDEAGAGPYHKKSVVEAEFEDTIRTTIYTGRPMRVFKTPYAMDWADNRQQELLQLQSKGVLGAAADVGNYTGAHTSEVRTLKEKKDGVQ